MSDVWSESLPILYGRSISTKVSVGLGFILKSRSV